MGKRKLSDADIQRIVELREKGLSLGQIALKVGSHTETVYYHCLRLGAESPRNKGKTWDKIKGPEVIVRGNHVVRRFTPQEDARLLRLERKGLNNADIARAIGRANSSVRNRLSTLARHQARKEQAAGIN